MNKRVNTPWECVVESLRGLHAVTIDLEKKNTVDLIDIGEIEDLLTDEELALLRRAIRAHVSRGRANMARALRGALEKLQAEIGAIEHRFLPRRPLALVVDNTKKNPAAAATAAGPINRPRRGTTNKKEYNP